MVTAYNTQDFHGGCGPPSTTTPSTSSTTVSPIGSNQTLELEYLDIFLCGFIDLPKSGVQCSERFPHFCVKCIVRGGYLTGETIDEYGIGHYTCRIVWYLTLLVGFVGIVSNALIIVIISRRKDGRSFDFLLSLLAYVDLFCCLTTFASSTAPVAYFENWHGRGLGTMYWIYASALTLLLWRSISIFVTLLITIERYLAIAYPLRSMTWFNNTRTRLQAVLMVASAILISIPRYSSLYIGPNIYGSQEGGLDVPALRHLPYVYLQTRLYAFWELTFQGAHNQVEYWIPIPVLLLFNYLSYKKVKKLCRKRQQMNCSQRSELQAARMFTPVVVLLLCCNLWPTIAFVIMHFWGIFHREMWMIWSLTIAMNSSVNFWIYYYRANTFRAEARLLFSQIATRLNIFPSLQITLTSNLSNHPNRYHSSRSNRASHSQISRYNTGTSSTVDTTPRCLVKESDSSYRTSRNNYFVALANPLPQS